MTDRTRRSTVLVAVTFLAIACLQVGIPLVGLFEERPARFAWHMYSAVVHEPQAWTEDATGARSRVDLRSMTADRRAEIDWTERLAPFLCQNPDVRAVILVQGDRETRSTCA